METLGYSPPLHSSVASARLNWNIYFLKVARGAWRALEAVASDSCGTTQASLGATGAARNRRAVEAAQHLLSLPCVAANPIDLLTRYKRCRTLPGVAEGVAVAAVEVRPRGQNGEDIRCIFLLFLVGYLLFVCHLYFVCIGFFLLSIRLVYRSYSEIIFVT